jgi:pyruvate/2-oxoglutarate dehydrogenase complex dihydrolipoamide acyltransferase (E2) component
VSEPEIARLARNLAEQNNVDWRRLSGTGPGGLILERDVLDFLARVMAGEEALDPTPEPLPDGMDEWPEVHADSVGNYARPSSA